MIKKVGNGKYVVLSRKGKRLSKPLPLNKAKQRLYLIEWFKAHKVKR